MKTNTAIHANAIQVENLGILILGESGSGKSELALELINRNHTFIADDLVLIEKIEHQIFISNPNQQYLLHLKDIGIIDANLITNKIQQKTQLDIVIKLDKLPSNDLTQLGLDQQSYTIDGINYPYYVLYNSKQRNLSLLIETIVKISSSNTLINQQIVQLQGNMACKLY